MSSTNTFFGLSSGSLVQLPHLDVLATTATTFILECAGLTARSLVLKEGSRLFCCSNVLPRLFLVGGQPVEASRCPSSQKELLQQGRALRLLLSAPRRLGSAASRCIRQLPNPGRQAAAKNGLNACKWHCPKLQACRQESSQSHVKRDLQIMLRSIHLVQDIRCRLLALEPTSFL